MVCFNSARELQGELPFLPNVIILATDVVKAVASVTTLRETLPNAGIFVVLERPKEPLPSQLLMAGASEIIRAPYNPLEAVILSERWLGNSRPDQVPDDSLRLADLEIALDRYTASKNGVRLNLTKLELRLLYCLSEHSPNLAPTERLLTFGWDTLGDPDAALIKTHISHIRKKLQEAGGIPFDITSRQTLGYTLSVSESSR